MRKPKRLGTSKKTTDKEKLHPLQVEYLERKNKKNETIEKKIELLPFLKDYLKDNFIEYKKTGKFILFKKVKEYTNFAGNLFEFDIQICKYIDQKSLPTLLLETNGTKDFFQTTEVLEALKEWQKNDLKLKTLFDKLKIIEQKNNTDFKLDYIQLRIGLHYNNINWNKIK